MRISQWVNDVFLDEVCCHLLHRLEIFYGEFTFKDSVSVAGELVLPFIELKFIFYEIPYSVLSRIETPTFRSALQWAKH